MTNVRAISARRIAAASLIAASLVGVSACSAINEQATTKRYNPSDGVALTVSTDQSKVGLRNLMIVSNGKDKQGRILGGIVNDGKAPATVSFSINGTAVGQPVKVANVGSAASSAAGTESAAPTNAVSLSDNAHKVIVPSTPKSAGELVDVTVKVDGVEKKIQVPVLDGTLEQYRQYIPGGASPVPTETKKSEAPKH